MSDDQTQQVGTDKAGRDDVSVHDYILGMFVTQAETGASQTMTVFTNGLILTGYVIGSREYFQGLADEAATGQGSSVELSKSLQQALEEVPPAVDVNKVSGWDFAHIRGQIMTSTGMLIPPSGPRVMRIRYDRIDGYMLGAFEVPD